MKEIRASYQTEMTNMLEKLEEVRREVAEAMESYDPVQEFVDKTKDLGVTVDFITRSGGHDWTFWQECLPKALRKAGDSFK